MPESITGFLQGLNTTDTKKKLVIGSEIIKYLEDPTSSIECDDIGQFIDGVVVWLPNSNFKVSFFHCSNTFINRRTY